MASEAVSPLLEEFGRKQTASKPVRSFLAKAGAQLGIPFPLIETAFLSAEDTALWDLGYSTPSVALSRPLVFIRTSAAGRRKA